MCISNGMDRSYRWEEGEEGFVSGEDAAIRI